MAKKKAETDPIHDKLDALIHATQDLFILQALTAGVGMDEVRKALKIGQSRVAHISKYVKQAKRSK